MEVDVIVRFHTFRSRQHDKVRPQLDENEIIEDDQIKQVRLCGTVVMA